MKTSTLSFRIVPVGLITLVAGLLLNSSASVRAEHTNVTRGSFSESDFEFACNAAAGGTTEVELGRLAADRATMPAVKRFGQQMVEDHGKAGNKLKQIATRHGAVLPAKPTAEQQKDIERLHRLTGAEFDREYVSLMVQDHKKDLKEFQKAAKKSDNRDLQAFATETSQVVEHHLEMVQSLEDQVKNRRASAQ